MVYLSCYKGYFIYIDTSLFNSGQPLFHAQPGCRQCPFPSTWSSSGLLAAATTAATATAATNGIPTSDDLSTEPLLQQPRSSFQGIHATAARTLSTAAAAGTCKPAQPAVTSVCVTSVLLESIFHSSLWLLPTLQSTLHKPAVFQSPILKSKATSVFPWSPVTI